MKEGLRLSYKTQKPTNEGKKGKKIRRPGRKRKKTKKKHIIK